MDAEIVWKVRGPESGNGIGGGAGVGVGTGDVGGTGILFMLPPPHPESKLKSRISAEKLDNLMLYVPREFSLFVRGG